MRHIPARHQHAKPLQRVFSHLFAPKPIPEPAPLPEHQQQAQQALDFVHAIHRNDTVAMRSLLERGMDPHARLPNGRVLLNEALSASNVDAAGLLLEHGADPRLHDAHGKSGLDIARAQYSHLSDMPGPSPQVPAFAGQGRAGQMLRDMIQPAATSEHAPSPSLRMTAAYPPVWGQDHVMPGMPENSLTDRLRARRQTASDATPVGPILDTEFKSRTMH